MKSCLSVILLLATAPVALCTQAEERISHPAPISLNGKLVVLNFGSAEEARTERGEQPEVWNKLAASPFGHKLP